MWSALPAAVAAHAIMSSSFPWLQGKYDMMLGKQLMAVSAEDKRKAVGIASPIAAKMLRERSAGRQHRLHTVWSDCIEAATMALVSWSQQPMVPLAAASHLLPVQFACAGRPTVCCRADPFNGI